MTLYRRNVTDQKHSKGRKNKEKKRREGKKAISVKMYRWPDKSAEERLEKGYENKFWKTISKKTKFIHYYLKEVRVYIWDKSKKNSVLK